jgi:NAD(P)-dependent dehydrogenase (short-subunit alcohol dehydrogenase family)
MSKKTILITGCSEGGIGAALAHALAKRGHYIFATARNISKIPESLTLLSNVMAVQLDVTSHTSVAEAAKIVTSTIQDHGGKGLDVLVNNAGRGYASPLLDVDIREAQRLYDTNVWGVLRTIQAFADSLILTRGRIVNVSSLGAVVNTPWIGMCL